MLETNLETYDFSGKTKEAGMKAGVPLPEKEARISTSFIR